MANSLSVLVTGATGLQGGAVLRSLLAKGHRVKAFTRRGDSSASNQLRRLGCRIAVGNFDDRDSLEMAMKGVDAVFAMATPEKEGTDTEIRHGRTIAAAIKRLGIQHLVYSSVASANRHTHIPFFDSKYKVEEYIVSLGVHYTIIAPVFFMENFKSPLMLASLQRGELKMPLPSTRVLQQIAVQDLGEFVTFAMENRKDFLGKRIDIASDELPGSKVAEILSEITGQSIYYSEAPLNKNTDRMEVELAQMYHWLNEIGFDVELQSLRSHYPDLVWNKFEIWAKNQDWSLFNTQKAA